MIKLSCLRCPGLGKQSCPSPLDPLSHNNGAVTGNDQFSSNPFQGSFPLPPWHCCPLQGAVETPCSLSPVLTMRTKLLPFTPTMLRFFLSILCLLVSVGQTFIYHMTLGNCVCSQRPRAYRIALDLAFCLLVLT